MKSHVIVEPETVVIDAIMPSAIAAPTTSSSPLESAERLPAATTAGLSGGTLLRKVRPIYPTEAIASRMQGTVTLFGTVGESGQLQGLRIISGDPVLGHAALEAVQQWQYEPYRLNGKPIPRTTRITVEFKLPSE
jgi:protein TonB